MALSRFESTSGVRHQFVGFHSAPFAQEAHAHLWIVWADFAGHGLVNGLVRQQRLVDVCDALLPDLTASLGDQATNEGLAMHVLRALEEEGCVAVEVVREAEGLRARLWRRGALG